MKKRNNKKKALPKFFQIFDYKYAFHDFAKLTGWLHALLWFRPKVFYTSKEAKKQHRKMEPFLFIANHHNFTDALAVSAVFWFRRVSMLVQDGVLKNKASLFLRWFQCIFVNRENIHYKTFKECFEVFRRGHCLAVFPEGHLVHSNEFETFKDGASLIAWKQNVRILPVFLPIRENSKKRQHIVVGEPFSPRDIATTERPSVEDFHLITLESEKRMQDLKDFYHKTKGEKHGKDKNPQ